MSRLERSFWSTLIILVVGVLGTCSFLGYHYSQKAQQRWMKEWSQAYDLSIVKIGPALTSSQHLDSIKLVPINGGQPLMRQRAMDAGLKTGYYDTVRFNLRNGKMASDLDVLERGYSPPLCAFAAAFFAAIALVLVFLLVGAVIDWLLKPRRPKPRCMAY